MECAMECHGLLIVEREKCAENGMPRAKRGEANYTMPRTAPQRHVGARHDCEMPSFRRMCLRPTQFSSRAAESDQVLSVSDLRMQAKLRCPRGVVTTPVTPAPPAES
jgi:hypothetical protein